MVCSISGCNKNIRNKKNQLCNAHYIKLRRHGSADYQRECNKTKQCIVTNCDKTRIAREWCVKHYDRWRTKGDPYATSFHVERHGMINHPLYTTWASMKARCYRENTPYYKYYGGRGIKMCDSWRFSFKQFVDDVGDKPSDKHSLDRIDNDGNYEPDNVRWATQSVQSKNQRVRVDNKSGHKGVCFDNYRGKWRAYIGGGKSRKELGYFDNLAAAIQKRCSADVQA